MPNQKLARLPLVSVVLLGSALVGLPLAWQLFPYEWRQLVWATWLGPAHLGDGQPATDLLLSYPMRLAIDRAGELLISDRGRRRRGRVVWRIDSAGIAHIFAGNGLMGDATEHSALEMTFNRPESLAVAPDGSVFLSDGYNHSVFRIAPDGSVERVAGTGDAGFSRDGGIASEAQLFRPADIRLDGNGNLFIADVRNHRVRRVETDGRLVTLAGNGRQGFDGDGGPATDASLNFPEGLFVDTQGRLFIGDEWNNAVRMVGLNGIISTVIGTGFPGRAQIGGVAHLSPVDDPENVLFTPDGLILSDGNNGRIIRVSPDGIIHLVAGRGETAPCIRLW